MDGDPSWRREKRSKGNHDPVDREIRGIVVRELQSGSEQQEHSGEQQPRGRGSHKPPSRRGGGQGSGSGASHGARRGAAGQGEGPSDDGGREGKTIPNIGALDTPPQFLEFDQSYMV